MFLSLRFSFGTFVHERNAFLNVFFFNTNRLKKIVKVWIKMILFNKIHYHKRWTCYILDVGLIDII